MYKNGILYSQRHASKGGVMSRLFICLFLLFGLVAGASAQDLIFKSGFENGEMTLNSIHATCLSAPNTSPVIGTTGVVVLRCTLFNNVSLQFDLGLVRVTAYVVESGSVFPFRNARLRFVQGGYTVSATSTCGNFSCFVFQQQGMTGMAPFIGQDFEILADLTDVQPSEGRHYTFVITSPSDISGTTFPPGGVYTVGGTPAIGFEIVPRR